MRSTSPCVRSSTHLNRVVLRMRVLKKNGTPTPTDAVWIVAVKSAAPF